MNKPARGQAKPQLIDMAYALDDFMGELSEFHCAMVDKHKNELIDELLASGLITNFDDEEYQEYLNG